MDATSITKGINDLNLSESVPPKYKYTCAFCETGYNEKMYHRYEFDCCSMMCLNAACEDRLKEEAAKRAAEGNTERFNRIDAGGGY